MTQMIHDLSKEGPYPQLEVLYCTISTKENKWTLAEMNTFCDCHGSWQSVNTYASEHLVSHVTTREHLVEIVQ